MADDHEAGKMIEKIKNCIRLENYYYSNHARNEMESEGFGIIFDAEICQAVLTGTVIESYLEDSPHPSCLILGKTGTGRPLHIVSAFSEEDNLAIIITVYQPDPERWIDFSRRKK